VSAFVERPKYLKLDADARSTALIAWLVARGVYAADVDSINPLNAVPTKEYAEFSAWWLAIGGAS
jgi:hypothetical protein